MAGVLVLFPRRHGALHGLRHRHGHLRAADPVVVRIGAETLRFSCIVLPLLAVSTFVNQLYQCLGYRTAATFLASCRQGIFFLPAVLLLPLWLHCAGVEMSQPVADLLTFVISMPFLAAFYRHHIRGHAE